MVAKSTDLVHTATNGGMTSDMGEAKPLYLGTLELPYKRSFERGHDIDLSEFTIHNCNGDRYIWRRMLDVKGIFYDYNSKNDNDDWLIMPPVRMEAGKSYALGIYFNNSVVPDDGLEIKMGTDNSPEAMTEQVVDFERLKGMMAESFDMAGMQYMSITPSSTADYHIGFHAVAKKEVVDDTHIVYIYIVFLLMRERPRQSLGV